MRVITNPKLAFYCASALALAAASAAADTTKASGTGASEPALGEVVVTAQRREENVQNVPIAVIAMSPEQLQQIGANSALDVVRLVPNMFGSNNVGLGTANTYSIRGLNNTESISTFDAPVGTYVDDIFIARQNANNFSLFDVDHIEVLSGPQGTLFGRNTTGGAVSVSLKKPGKEVAGYVEAGVASFSGRSARFSVDLPVSATLLTKLSGFYVKDDGYVKDVTTGQTLNGNDNRGVRGAIRWLPTSKVTWDLSADYMDQKNLNILNTPTANGDRISNVGLNTDFSYYPTLFSGPKSKYPLGNHVTQHSITSNLAWDTDIGLVNVITGWRDMSQKFFIDFFDSPVPTVQSGGANGGEFIIVNEGRHQQFSQEFKLNGSALNDKLTYSTGLFYLNEMNHTDLGQDFLLAGTTGGVLPPGICILGGIACSTPTSVPGTVEFSFMPFFYDRMLYNTTHSWAVYGQGDYKLAQDWTLTVGARYTDETKSISYTANDNPYAFAPNQFNTADIVAAGLPTKQSIQVVTPRVALKYDISPNANVYVSATRGFKGGGWNARSSTANLVLPFSPEKTWSYEAGLRSEAFEHRLRANLTAFWSNTQSYQLPTAYVPPGGGADVFITGNFAGLQVRGIEAEFAAIPVDDLTVFLNLGVQDGKYKDLSDAVVAQQARCQAEITAGAGTSDCGQGIVTPRGDISIPSRLPTHSIKAGVAYVFHLGFADLTPNISIENLGSYEVDTASANPNSRSDGYSQWNAGLTFTGVGEHRNWSVIGNCSNCSDRVILASKLPPTLYYQDPRRWSVTFRYKF